MKQVANQNRRKINREGGGRGRHCDTSRESRCSTCTISYNAFRIRQHVILESVLARTRMCPLLCLCVTQIVVVFAKSRIDDDNAWHIALTKISSNSSAQCQLSRRTVTSTTIDRFSTQSRVRGIKYYTSLHKAHPVSPVSPSLSIFFINLRW